MKQLAAVAVLRAYWISSSLISEKMQANDYFVKAIEVELVATGNVAKYSKEEEEKHDLEFTAPKDGAVPAEFGCKINFNKILTKEERSWIRKNAATMLAMVSHVFKVRGHHYIKD
jgi:hypothetical protein